MPSCRTAQGSEALFIWCQTWGVHKSPIHLPDQHYINTDQGRVGVAGPRMPPAVNLCRLITYKFNLCLYRQMLERVVLMAGQISLTRFSVAWCRSTAWITTSMKVPITFPFFSKVNLVLMKSLACLLSGMSSSFHNVGIFVDVLTQGRKIWV